MGLADKYSMDDYDPSLELPTPLDLLILAAPRSGTRYMKTIFRSVGVDIGHEELRPRGASTMFFCVEDVWYPGKHWLGDDPKRTRRSMYEFQNVWHMTRDPRRVIASISSEQRPLKGGIWVWIERHLGLSCGLAPLEYRAMLFWVGWNRLIERQNPHRRFRIEDIDVEWPWMAEAMGIGGTPLPNSPRDIGTPKGMSIGRKSISWDEMKSIDARAGEAVRELALRYGYED